MSFSSGQSRLIQLPPTQDDEQEEGGYFEANSAADLMAQLDLDDNVLERVLYRGDIFGNYRILGFIGAGGMGEIYAAERMEDDGPRRIAVALKVLSREHAADSHLIQRLEREATLCGQVRSRHVVRLYEYGLDEKGRGFVAMEMLHGEELFDRMKHHKVFPLGKLAEITLQILRGLHDIHSAEIIHRDIKPENIFLARDRKSGEEFVKLLDFGIARKVHDPDDPLVKQPGQLLATPQYMSPEQTRSPEVDHRSDIYSLGVVLYECVAGCSPFDSETPYATMIAHQKEAVPLLPSTLDPEFCEIIYKALAKKPRERWQSAREMAQVIQSWINETSWVDEIPGSAGFSIKEDEEPDDLFADILLDSPQNKRAPTNATPMFGSSSAKNARDTPRAAAAGVVIRKRRKSSGAASPASEFDPTRGVFEEVGAPPSPSPSPSQHDGLFDFGEKPAAAPEPRPADAAPSRSQPLAAPARMEGTFKNEQSLELEEIELSPTTRDLLQQSATVQPPRSSQSRTSALPESEQSSKAAKYITGAVILFILIAVGVALASMLGGKSEDASADTNAETSATESPGDSFVEPISE